MSSNTVPIFLISFLVLFFELVVIRWLSSEVQVFAWLKNLPLMAAFLGLGLGTLQPAPTRQISQRFLWLFAVLALLLVASGPLQLDRISFPDPSITTWHAPDPTASAWYEPLGPVATTGAFLAVVSVVSALVAALFTLLGRTLGACMNSTQPLRAYSVNIFGSLVGVLVFTLLSFLQTPPIAWVGVGLIAALPLVASARTVALPVLLTLGVVLAYSLRGDVLWSPYYRVGYSSIPGSSPPIGHTVTVNRHYHQQAVGLSDEALTRYPHLAELRAEYDLPFLVAPRRDAVALLGAGAGNDAAAALRQGAKRIVAVEIDPAIIELGHRLHDERPYSSERVELINTDARAWLRQTDDRFDVISFGLVDSHTMLSAMSSVRLESYLYTVESLRDLLRLLKPDGVAAMSFVVGSNDWQGRRLYNTIEQASGSPPIDLDLPNYGTSYLFGPGVRREAVVGVGGRYGFRDVTDQYRGADIRPSTDDWPFLYLNPNQPPVAYLVVLLGFLGFSLAAIRLASRPWLLAPGRGSRMAAGPSRPGKPALAQVPRPAGPVVAAPSRSLGDMTESRAAGDKPPPYRNDGTDALAISMATHPPTARALNLQMFLMGAAFLLIETKSIAELSLLFGSTWVVNAAVFAAILAMVLAANGIVSRWHTPNVGVVYTLLVLSLVLGFAFPVSALNALGLLERAAVGSMLSALPIAFSGVVFATAFRMAPRASTALGWNLFGAIVGGTLEASSMWLGIKALSLVAAALYVLSWVAFEAARRATSPPAPAHAERAAAPGQ